MTGRVAIVTGGTTGIGLATARALINSGRRVAVGARGAARAFTRIAAAGQITLAEARAKIAHSNPQGRIVQPGEVAALIDFFCSDRAPGFTNVDVQINAGADW
jgi:NAD(P)-dependent dehydrogenase (short-subunit alcohol dehydrogenase family)